VNKKQETLFNRLLAFGFDKQDASFLMKFRENSAREMLRGFRRPKRRRCLFEGCINLAEPPKEFCKVHAFTPETRRFDVKEVL